MREKFNAILQLFGNSSCGFTISRAKALIVTVGATAISFAAISIGAGEACINGNLLNFEWEFTRKVLREIFIWFIIWKWGVMRAGSWRLEVGSWKLEAKKMVIAILVICQKYNQYPIFVNLPKTLDMILKPLRRCLL